MKNTSTKKKSKLLPNKVGHRYNFDSIPERRDGDSLKYSDINKKVLPMWVADMDYYVLPEITIAIKRKADLACFGYTNVSKGYFHSYQLWLKNNYDIEIPVSHFIFSSGVVASIDSIFKHILPPHSDILIFTPIYHTFFHCIENTGHHAHEVEIDYNRANATYKLDFKKVENALKENKNIKALLLCNPHNPTGHIYSLFELTRLARLCAKYHILLISDEIHGDITVPKKKYHPILSIPEKELLNDVVVLTSPTKSFNLAGINTSVIIVGDKVLREDIQKYVYQDDIGEPNSFACPATVAAYTYGYDWNIEMREYVNKNRIYFTEFINAHLPRLKVVKGEATYLLWLDISSYSSDSEKFSKELKKKVGLWVTSGHTFRGNGREFIRLNLATNMANIKDCCSRLMEFLKDYQ